MIGLFVCVVEKMIVTLDLWTIGYLPARMTIYVLFWERKGFFSPLFKNRRLERSRIDEQNLQENETKKDVDENAPYETKRT